MSPYIYLMMVDARRERYADGFAGSLFKGDGKLTAISAHCLLESLLASQWK